MRAVERPVRQRPGLPIYLAAASLLLAALLLPSAASAQWQTCGTNNICNTNTGNVGVGNTNPTNYPLTVQGGTGVGPAGQSYSVFDIIPGTAAAGQTTALRTFNSNKLQLTTWTGSAWNSGLTIDTSGNVGIGSTAPGELLDLFSANTYPRIKLTGNVASGVLLTTSTAGSKATALIAGSGASAFEYDSSGSFSILRATKGNVGNGGGTPSMSIDGGGNVGVGTSGPTTRLTVTDGAAPYAAGATDLLQLKRGTANGATDGSGGTSILLGNASNAFRIKYGGTTDRLSFLDGGNGEVLSLANGGSVGVGTVPATGSPYKLDVNGAAHVSGSMTVDGNISAKYQDVAEWVPSSQKLSAGTVVVLDGERANHVLASTASYDTAVAGVISERPGLSLGEGGEGKVLVATTGRVKVKVDATRAPIKVGDLLVTSEAEGVAMKSVPVDLGGVRIHRPGTIIGKALEPLERGTGEILVLLSLQ